MSREELRSEHTCVTFQPAKSQKEESRAKTNCLSKGTENSLASFSLFTRGTRTLSEHIVHKGKEDRLKGGGGKQQQQKKKKRKKKKKSLAPHLPFQCPEGSISLHLFHIIIMASQLLKRAPVQRQMVHDTAKPWSLSHQLRSEESPSLPSFPCH